MENDSFLYQGLGWFDSPNDYKISVKLESHSFNIGNLNKINKNE